jgi:16S rRNA (adenine1518-N6/adenine1519-N6)-dimethyltransferase
MPSTPRRPPDSKEEIRAALATAGLHPHKRFGQNFLGDASILDRIVQASEVGPSSVVLEVGPGLGALTARLLATGAAVVAVEIDHGLARFLRETVPAPELVLIEGDAIGGKGRLSTEVAAALRSAVARRRARGFEVVSNLPYGISSPFVASLMADPGPPLRATLLLQSEFAAALVARPSTDEYSALSVFARTFFDVQRRMSVPRHAFVPQPDVDSAVVTLVPRADRPADAERFSRFVQRLFQGRRKALSTTLRGLVPDAAAWLAGAGFDPRVRVDALEPARIVELFEKVGGPGGPERDSIPEA